MAREPSVSSATVRFPRRALKRMSAMPCRNTLPLEDGRVVSLRRQSVGWPLSILFGAGIMPGIPAV